MRKFNVTVNGIAYEVEVEEVGGVAPTYAAAPAPTPAPVAAAPVAPAATPAPAAAPAPAAKPAGKAGATTVKAPMPGNIIKVNVKAGQSIKKGDVICVLEAMKMENDICAPSDGTVATVDVAQGGSVATDDVIVTID